MIHPDTELRQADERIGLGVFATRPIPAGTIVWALDALDQRLRPEDVHRIGPSYEPLLDRYAYRNALGEHVLCWDLARWVNHSCDANVLSTGWEFDVAIRDIAAGEEIRNDYGALNLDVGFECLCGADACRGSVEPEDFQRLSAQWDERTRRVLPAIPHVPQPLWRWVAPKRAVRAAIRDPERMPSIESHRLPALVERLRALGSTR